MQATPQDVRSAAARLGFVVPAEHEVDYLELLKGTDRAVAALLEEPDYPTPVDLERFPRTHVHLPAASDNPLKGWAWKCEIQGAPSGLLAGRTVCAKDTVAVSGVPLRFGTDAFKDYVPNVDATVITRVLENGGKFVGKAACENFSHGAGSFSSPYGPVENPFALGFSTGGSSSGCGALIASGAVDMGVGGDQGGSIRIPAALCGIVGLKPTFGLVPYTGVLTSDAGSDSVGPMARTVLDSALLLQATAGYDGIDDRQLGALVPSAVPSYSNLVLEGRAIGIRGLKVGLLREGFAHSALSASVDAEVRAAIAKFEELGATVAEVSVPLHSKAEPLCHILNKFSSSQARQGKQVGRRGLYLNDYFDQLLPWNSEKYEKARYFVSGTAMSGEYGWSKYPTLYGRAMNISRRLKEEYDAALADFDVLVMPTVTQPARRHVSPDAGPLAWAQASPGIISNTSSFNLTGHPALTIPCGFVAPHQDDILCAEDEAIRLPVGLMIVGRLWDETKVLQVGDAWEKAFDWKKM